MSQSFMASRPLQYRPSEPGRTLAAPVALRTSTFTAPAEPARRRRIWDLSSNLHCSVVGTCLSTVQLRQLLGRMGSDDVAGLSDHAIHNRGVLAAGRNDAAGKILNKALDRQHDAVIRRFSKASTPAELRSLWQAAFDEGAVAGPYWAVLTHPLADQALVRDVFGDVHMLSHLVGSATRLDLARLKRLEADLAARDDLIARQQQRLNALGSDRDGLLRRLAELEKETRRRAGLQASPAAPAGAEEADIERLRAQLADERARSAHLAGRLAEQFQLVEAIRARLDRALGEIKDLEQEATRVDALVGSTAGEDAATAPRDRLAGRCILYVGGMPQTVEHLRAFVTRLGGSLIRHDGGVDESLSLLPGLVGQADVALFPVPHVSHGAATRIKRLCGDAGKPFVPLRSAGLASAVAALLMAEG